MLSWAVTGISRLLLNLLCPGLIIDAFGELRDKEETLSAEMQNKCFICGLPKNEFDHVPHGFDNHTTKQHNMAHYMWAQQNMWSVARYVIHSLFYIYTEQTGFSCSTW